MTDATVKVVAPSDPRYHEMSFMLQALEGYIILLAAIAVFAIISFPARSKKDRASRIDVTVPKNAMLRSAPDNSIALQEAASGRVQKEAIPYAEQKVSPDALKRAREA